MRLRRVVYENYCQHDREIEFADGMNALLGPNGSGKTNMLNGIVWCLTGVDRNAGLKADNISLHAAPAAKAGVRVFFEHDGAEVEVWRGLRQGQSIRVNQEKSVTGDKAVRTLLRKVLGVPERVLLDYVFVAQRKIFDFLEADPVAVAASLSQLFGTEKAVHLYQLLGEARLPPAPVPYEADSLAAHLVRCRQKLAEAQATLKGLDGLPDPWVESESPEYAAVEALRRRGELEAQLRDCEANEENTNNELLVLGPVRAADKGAYDAAEALAPRHKAAAESARRGLQAWELHTRMSALVQEQRRRQTKLEARYESLMAHPPPRPAGYIDESSQELDQINGWAREVDDLRKFLRSWEQTGKAACEACGTPVAVIAERVPEARARLEEIGPLVTDSQLRWVASQGYRVDARLHQDDVNRVVAQLAALKTSEVAVPPAPAESEDELHLQLHDAQLADEEREELRADWQLAEMAWQGAQGRLKGWQEVKKSTQAALAKLPAVHSYGHGNPLVVLKKLREAIRLRDEAKLKVDYLGRLIKEDEGRLAQAHAALARGARIEQLQAHLEELREVFHRDSLAREVAEGYVAAIRDGTDGQPGVNDLLALFDAPFRAADFIDWRYRVRLASGKEHSALRLSDGQKVLLALAFRVVVNSLFARELGLLCLDEPTAGLDEDNRACLDVALGRLRELSKSRGLQVILVTHDRDTGLFDKCYRLAAAR